MKAKIFTFFLLIVAQLALKGQDEHFSQFFALPIHMNPALTGAYEGTYRMTAIYRDQWNSALDSPYKTFAAGGDTRLDFDFGRLQTDDHFGLGLFFVSDRVAEFQAATNKISGYMSYHKKFGDRVPSYLGAGFKFGVIQRNINYDNITFQDQFNQIDDFDQPTSEVLPPNNIGAFDVSLGLNYYIKMESGTRYYVGVAAHHLTQPNISYFNRLQNPNPALDLSQTLPSKYVFHVSMDQELKYRFSLQPRLIYQSQADFQQLDFGSNIEYTFKSLESSLILGLWITGIDDLDGFHVENVTPLVGIRQGQFIFGFSYDVHLRDAFESTFGLNTFEFSIRFTGEYEEAGAFCPTF